MNKSYATERQEAEKEERAREAQQRGAQRSLYGGNWEWNLKTKEYRWCDEMHRIFQVTPQESPLRTGTFLNRVHPEDRDKVVKALGNALVGVQPYDLEHRLLWPDGTVRFVRGQADVTFDEAGRPLCMTGTVQDITAARQADAVRQE